MSLLSSIDTSQYTTPYAAAQDISPFQTLREEDAAKQETPNVAAEDYETPKVDLNNYYSNVLPPDVKNNLGSNLSKLSQNLSDALNYAVENGMTAQDIVHIQKAKYAYNAMLNVAKHSNFELEI